MLAQFGPGSTTTVTRRALLAASLSLPVVRLSADVSAQRMPGKRMPGIGLPIAWPEQTPGAGFFIRHGYACENTWYNPGFWHTGEDWYAIDVDSAGAHVLAIADGRVVFAGSDYPGRVVVIQHGDEFFSMYGHLDYGLDVGNADQIVSGQRIGQVLNRIDGAAPSHLHFEIRTFLTTPEVNGANPRYPFACGQDCPPGPGYWPIDAPEHPSAMGWRNPQHVIGHHLVNGDSKVVAESVSEATVPVFNLPAGRSGSDQIGEVSVKAREHLPLVSVAAGPDSSERTSALGYRLWYHLSLPDGGEGWVQAATASDQETGSDGRPSAIEMRFLPIVM